MIKKYRILIIGGYGNFGKYIAKTLGKNPQVELAIVGRDSRKAEAIAKKLNAINPVEVWYCDIFKNLHEILGRWQPFIVIHTSGPFQVQDYIVAKTCLAFNCHYIDIADSRQFVSNINQFDAEAKAKKLLLCSGASSVPGLSSAIIENYRPYFSQLESIDYAIATAQLTNQGLATTAGVLSYAGKPFYTQLNGKKYKLYGWQDIRLKSFWRLNNRLLGNCDIPDLELFQKHYPSLKTIRFQAGLELKSLQTILFLMSWLVRIRLLPSLDKFAKLMLSISHLFNRFGTNNTGFYMCLNGLDNEKNPLTIRFDIYAEHGDGLYIPCVPSILLTESLMKEDLPLSGAMPCVGLISLERYLAKLHDLGLRIAWREQEQAT